MSTTIALNVSKTGISLVCGWLVATEGDKKGTSFTIHSEKDLIGRGSQFGVDHSFDKAAPAQVSAPVQRSYNGSMIICEKGLIAGRTFLKEKYDITVFGISVEYLPEKLTVTLAK